MLKGAQDVRAIAGTVGPEATGNLTDHALSEQRRRLTGTIAEHRTLSGERSEHAPCAFKVPTSCQLKDHIPINRVQKLRTALLGERLSAGIQEATRDCGVDRAASSHVANCTSVVVTVGEGAKSSLIRSLH